MAYFLMFCNIFREFTVVMFINFFTAPGQPPCLVGGLHVPGSQNNPKSSPDSNTPRSNAGATGRICPPPQESQLKLAISGK